MDAFTVFGLVVIPVGIFLIGFAAGADFGRNQERKRR